MEFGSRHARQGAASDGGARPVAQSRDPNATRRVNRPMTATPRPAADGQTGR
jgi:hypothetical protein